MKTIEITVDAALAKQYRRKFLKAFPNGSTERMPLKRFMSGFVEDRLREEIEFVEEEAQSD